MTTPKSILIAREVTARLENITRANGYHTDAGLNVTRGWGMHALSDALDGEGSLPLLAIHTARDDVTQRNWTKASHTREVQIEGFVLVDDDTPPADALDLLYVDIEHALGLGNDETLGGLAAAVGDPAAAFQIPEDGSRVAILIFTLPITYITNSP